MTAAAILPESTKSDAITLLCDKCKRQQEYDRGIDPSIPAEVATIVVSRCDRCAPLSRSSRLSTATLP